MLHYYHSPHQPPIIQITNQLKPAPLVQEEEVPPIAPVRLVDQAPATSNVERKGVTRLCLLILFLGGGVSYHTGLVEADNYLHLLWTLVLRMVTRLTEWDGNLENGVGYF